jgi:hypothetical protein
MPWLLLPLLLPTLLLRLQLRLRLLLCLLRRLVAGDADPSLQEVTCAAALGMEMHRV